MSMCQIPTQQCSGETGTHDRSLYFSINSFVEDKRARLWHFPACYLFNFPSASLPLPSKGTSACGGGEGKEAGSAPPGSAIAEHGSSGKKEKTNKWSKKMKWGQTVCWEQSCVPFGAEPHSQPKQAVTMHRQRELHTQGAAGDCKHREHPGLRLLAPMSLCSVLFLTHSLILLKAAGVGQELFWTLRKQRWKRYNLDTYGCDPRLQCKMPNPLPQVEKRCSRNREGKGAVWK